MRINIQTCAVAVTESSIMRLSNPLVIFSGLALLDWFILCQEQDAGGDEQRPYKFGFNIEGYQHRYEEKDEKGIVMGEYGFITGDGVYHLTVYATDENGNFKILRTKNTHIGLPGEPTTTALPTRPSPPTKVANKISPAEKLLGKPGCGGCLIPTTSSPSVATSAAAIGGYFQGPISTPIRPSGNPAGGYGNPYSKSIKNSPRAETSTQSPVTRAVYSSNAQNSDRNSPQTPSTFLLTPYGANSEKPKTLQGRMESLNPESRGDAPQKINTINVSGKQKVPPLTGLKQNQLIREKGTTQPAYPDVPEFKNFPDGPKMRDFASNVPKMMENVKTLEDLQALFYMFNYTLTYHGHNEVGDIAGNKKGSYFFNGRDGLGRNVSYVANEYGYQPNITLYDLSDQETPKEDTEKDLTKVLGNEFRWFYGHKEDNNV